MCKFVLLIRFLLIQCNMYLDKRLCINCISFSVKLSKLLRAVLVIMVVL